MILRVSRSYRRRCALVRNKRTLSVGNGKNSSALIYTPYNQRSYSTMIKALQEKDYVDMLSDYAKTLKQSPIRSLFPLLKIPGMISLGAGIPSPEAFPIAGISVKLTGGESVDVPEDILKSGMTYTSSKGLPKLVEWIIQHQIDVHYHRPAEDWDVCLTNGSQDGISKIFQMLCNEDDIVLCDNPIYAGARAAMGIIKCHGVETDQHGLVPEALQKTLEEWPDKATKPRVLYTVPTGQNPSGSTLSHDRRKQILKIASDHNLIILEDDPYWYLCLGENPEPIESLASMDKEGRVLRCDSFSKIISPGLRLGWVTGPKPLVARIQLLNQRTVIHASGISQAIVLSILQSWGKEGFAKHVKELQALYTKKRDAILSFCTKYLTGLATWHTPRAGMFVWIKLTGIDDSEDLIRNHAVKAKVIFLWGASCSPSGEKSPYVRAAFSLASIEQMEEGIKRLASVLKDRK